MKRTGMCPKCSSDNILVDAKVVDRGESFAQHHMIVSTFRNPDALIWKGQQSSEVSAWICGDCGFIEFYADSPDDLALP